MTGAELALTDPAPFEVAWPDGEAARARDLTEIWLRRFASRHTRTCYRRDLTRWLAWCETCRVSPRDARLAHVDLWIEKQRTEGAAPASIARRVSAISSWYGYLVRNTADDPIPLATRNPADTDAKPKLDSDFSPTVGLSRSEADRLITAADADGPASSALVRLLLVNGLRIGSVLSARIENLGHDSGHRTLSLVRKGGHAARVPIAPAVGGPIDAMLAARGGPVAGLLFVTDRGRPMYQAWVFRRIRLLAKRAGIPQWDQLSAHSLRSTAITQYMDAGGSLREAQDFANHADPRTTRKYDKNRHNLDRHASYVLAGRYGVREDA